MALRRSIKLPSIVFILVLIHTDAFRTVCYYSNWAQYRPEPGKYVPKNINPDFCTHLMYAFAEPVPRDFSLKGFEWNDDTMYAEVMKLRQKAPNIKILLAVGGWNMGSNLFMPLVVTPETRASFARNSITYLRAKGFDGFDMDWEYPGAVDRNSTPADKPRFQLLMEELMRAFTAEATNTGRPRLMLTVATAAGKRNIDNGYYVANLSRTVDFISIMTYDFHGAWEKTVGLNSPLYAHTDETGDARLLNADWAAKYYVAQGAPKEKLNIGIATYGRSYTLEDPTRHSIGSPARQKGKPGNFSREGGVLSYYEICDMFKDALTVQVASQKNPYRVKGDQWVGYDDVDSVKAKACYARTNGYGGILFWTIDFDDFEGKFCNQGPYPLLTAATNAAKNPSECGMNTTSQPGLMTCPTLGNSFRAASSPGNTGGIRTYYNTTVAFRWLL